MSKPLQEPTFLILTALLREPLHGYALLSEVENVSDGRVRLRVGTLYAALDRLAGEGLVAVESEDVVNGRLRRTYAVTARGSATLAAEVDRMSALASKARAGLRAASPAARWSGGDSGVSSPRRTPTDALTWRSPA